MPACAAASYTAVALPTASAAGVSVVESVMGPPRWCAGRVAARVAAGLLAPSRRPAGQRRAGPGHRAAPAGKMFARGPPPTPKPPANAGPTRGRG